MDNLENLVYQEQKEVMVDLELLDQKDLKVRILSGFNFQILKHLTL